MLNRACLVIVEQMVAPFSDSNLNGSQPQRLDFARDDGILVVV